MSWRASVLCALAPWLVSRALVGVALLTNTVLRRTVTVNGPRYGTRSHSGLLSWDAAWYLDIAQQGYGSLDREAVRFFPLFPLIGRFLAPDPLRGALLVVVANLAALVFLVLLHRMTIAEFDDHRLAHRAVWLAALGPASFVLVMGYTESLAALLAVATIWSARRHKWGIAAIAGAFAGALRPSGLFLVAPLAVELVVQFGRARMPERARALIAVAAPGLGTVPYLIWMQWKYDDWRLPYRVQQEEGLKGSFNNPVGTVKNALFNIDGPDLVLGQRGLWTVLFCGLLVVVARKLPLSYLAFAAVSLWVAVATVSLGSVERYVYATFPFVLALALVTGGSTRERIAVTVSGGVMTAYALLAFMDVYVP